MQPGRPSETVDALEDGIGFRKQLGGICQETAAAVGSGEAPDGAGLGIFRDAGDEVSYFALKLPVVPGPDAPGPAKAGTTPVPWPAPCVVLLVSHPSPGEFLRHGIKLPDLRKIAAHRDKPRAISTMRYRADQRAVVGRHDLDLCARSHRESVA